MPLPEQTELTAKHVVDAAVKIHSALGPGLLESVYEKCLGIELAKRDVDYDRQVSVPIVYEGVAVEPGLRIDLIANKCVVVELKSAERLLPVHEAQLLTYLKLSGMRLGLLLNFNVALMKQGIRRIIL
ncbi:MAG TPA: GxxExxY protein [Burkholderiales bacterium]|nr:GxxExxY protein [Burkholderiales bacterium]